MERLRLSRCPWWSLRTKLRPVRDHLKELRRPQDQPFWVMGFQYCIMSVPSCWKGSLWASMNLEVWFLPSPTVYAQ